MNEKYSFVSNTDKLLVHYLIFKFQSILLLSKSCLEKLQVSAEFCNIFHSSHKFENNCLRLGLH